MVRHGKKRSQGVIKTGGNHGDKSIVPDPEESQEKEHGNLKRRRMKSPDKEKQNPTFSTGQEQQEEGTDPKPEPQEKVVMKQEEAKDRTPVKPRIRSINKKSSGSPAKVSEWKQVKLAYYFGRKSPEASKARETQSQTTAKQNQGAQSPF